MYEKRLKCLFQLLISEHTINTALYHAYTQDRFNITLDESTDRRRWTRFLRTSCNPGGRWSDAEDLLREHCLGPGFVTQAFAKDSSAGSILPAIAEDRPNEALIVDVEMSALPIAAIDLNQLSVNMRG